MKQIDKSFDFSVPSYYYEETPRYLIDLNNRVIHSGDKVEIKYTAGPYGRTETVNGEVAEIDATSSIRLKNGQYICVAEGYDFENSEKHGKFIVKTTKRHGFGPMDEHQHSTYVKIIND